MNLIKVNSNGKMFNLHIRDDADASVAAEIFKIKEYRIVEDIIKSATSVIIDAGAHAGFFSLYVRSLNSNVKILAIEPEPDNIKLLHRHLEENQVDNVEIIEAGLSAKTGNRLLRLSKDSHNHRLTSLSKKDPNVKAISVYTYSLSDLFKKCIIKDVSLLKMDIEGEEFEIFESLSDEYLQRIQAVILEYHTKGGKNLKEIEERLRENRFGVQIFPSRFDKSMGFIFAKSKRQN